jgi:hypothetical protein
MSLAEMILSDLRTCFEEHRREFEFLHNYKGVPLITKAGLSSVHEDRAIFDVIPPTSVCLAWEERALLLSDGILEPIEGRVLAFDLAAGKVELGGFLYAGYRFGNRHEVRVEPSDPILVEIRAPGEVFQGQLADLSMSGAGVTISKPAIQGSAENTLMRSTSVELNINLPDCNVQVPGQELSRMDQGSDSRLAVIFSTGVAGKNILLRYIIQRRDEIRKEVQEKYAAFLAQDRRV